MLEDHRGVEKVRLRVQVVNVNLETWKCVWECVERTCGRYQETRKRSVPTPALFTQLAKTLKAALTGRPQDNTSPPEVKNVGPGDSQTDESTEEKEGEEEDEEEEEDDEMPQSGEAAD